MDACGPSTRWCRVAPGRHPSLWRRHVSELAIRRGAAPALAVDGLSYAYPRAPRRALDAVSLEIAPGEFVLLAGRSASGKSTLLKAACGLVPHFHGGEIDGAVTVAGLDAIESGPGELAAVVGYVAQDPETQVVSTTVAAEIELPLGMRGGPPPPRRPPAASRRSLSPSRSPPCSAAPSTPSPAVSSSASPSPPRSSPAPAWSSWTSPPPSWTRSPATS